MYFSAFPTTDFNGTTLLDITRKAKLSSVVEFDALSYMDYRVEEGEKPEDVAFYYYDDPTYAWLVLLANDIVDPYTHWPKSMFAFEEYLKVQYADKSGTTGEAVIEWCRNATIGANILYYQSHIDPDITLNRASYLNASNEARVEFYPVRVYEYEFKLNEQNREIVLINKSLAPYIKDKLEATLNDE